MPTRSLHRCRISLQGLKESIREVGHHVLSVKGCLHPSVRQMLYAVLGVGFVTRMFFASRGNLNLDEGQWLYDARLLAQGAIPFVDWTTRAPLLLGVTACFSKLFGNGLLTARLVSVASATANAFVLYRIGKEGASGKVGLAAAALFSLSPFVIYQTIIIHEHPLQGLLVSLSMLFLLRALQKGHNSDAFWHGLLLALAYLVRRSSPVYFLTEPILWLLFRKKIIAVFEKLCYTAIGAIVGILPLIPLVIMTDLRWMWVQYGAGSLRIAPSTSQDYSATNIVFNAIFFLIPHCILLVRYFVQRLPRWGYAPDLRQIATYAGIVLSLICFLLLSLPGSWRDRYNVIPVTRLEGYAATVLFGVGLLLAVPKSRRHSDSRVQQPLAGVSAFWPLTIAGFYVFVKRRWILDYSMELVPPICLMAGGALFPGERGEGAAQTPFSWRQRMFAPAIAVSLVVIHTVWTGCILCFRPTYARSWSQSHVAAVGDYVASRTAPDEEIFTGDTIFGITARRPIVLNISHPAIYYTTGSMDPVPYDPYDIIPSQRDLLHFLEQHDVRYMPSDARTRGFIANYPPLEAFVGAHYREEAVIGTTHIYRRLSEDEAKRPLREDLSVDKKAHSVHANYGYQMELLGYGLEEDLTPGEEAVVTLYWRFLSTMRPLYEIECQLLAPNYDVWGRNILSFPGYSDSESLDTIYRQTIPLSVREGFPAPAFARLKVAIRDPESGDYLPVIGKQYEMLGHGATFGQLRVIERPEEPARGRWPLATFGQIAALVDVSLPRNWIAGSQNAVALTWEALGSTERDYTVFVHLVDQDGNLIAQDDSQPRDGFFPTSLWQPGDVVPDSYSLEIPSDVEVHQSYHLLVGYYLLADLERLPVWDASGNPLPNHQFTLAQDIVISGDAADAQAGDIEETEPVQEPSHEY